MTATNTELGKAQVFRLRTRKPLGNHVDHLTTALTITWKYDSEAMFPRGAEKEAILTFERLIDPVSGENGFSELVQVSTGGGVKEWLYYVADSDAFMRSLNRYLDRQPKYPIEIKWYDDPGWKIWEEAVTYLRDRGERP